MQYPNQNLTTPAHGKYKLWWPTSAVYAIAFYVYCSDNVSCDDLNAFLISVRINWKSQLSWMEVFFCLVLTARNASIALGKSLSLGDFWTIWDTCGWISQVAWEQPKHSFLFTGTIRQKSVRIQAGCFRMEKREGKGNASLCRGTAAAGIWTLWLSTSHSCVEVPHTITETSSWKMQKGQENSKGEVS